MSKGYELTTNANGWLRISTLSFRKSCNVSFLLTVYYRFKRKGRYIPAITDEAVYSSYYKDNFVIESGWDNWFGYDWSADNIETDVFLKEFYRKHCET